jgi:hypothetical protein
VKQVDQMHASSNFPSMRTKKVGTLVTSLYVCTLCHDNTTTSFPGLFPFCHWEGGKRPKSLGTRLEKALANRWAFCCRCLNIAGAFL